MLRRFGLMIASRALSARTSQKLTTLNLRSYQLTSLLTFVFIRIQEQGESLEESREERTTLWSFTEPFLLNESSLRTLLHSIVKTGD